MLCLSTDRRHCIPAWARFAAVIWLIIWIPAYWRAWGALNFLHLCDIAVLLGSIGIAIQNPLLISSQTVSSLFVDLVWLLDVLWRVIAGRHLIGGTEYLFDPRFPLRIRLLTMFHLALPLALLWALARTGYDRRAWRLQSAIALAALIASRFAGRALNINFAFIDPVFRRTFGPAPVHVAVIFLFLALIAYLPAHILLARLFGPSRMEKS